MRTLLALALLASCESKTVECGAGTELVDGKCVAAAAPKESGEAVASVEKSTAKPESEAGPVARMEGFRKSMCECKDTVCANKVNEEMTKWGTEMAKNAKPGDEKLDPEFAKKSGVILTKYTECMTKLMLDGMRGTWVCSNDQDKMRNVEVQFAALMASEPVQLKYGESLVRLAIRRKRPGGDEAMIVSSEGSFDCSSYDGCFIAAKFDDKPIKKFYAGRSSDFSAVFIRNASEWIAELRGAKKLIVELPIGNRSVQASFDLKPPDCLK